MDIIDENIKPRWTLILSNSVRNFKSLIEILGIEVLGPVVNIRTMKRAVAKSQRRAALFNNRLIVHFYLLR